MDKKTTASKKAPAKQGFLQSKKFKYGSTALAFTVSVVAVLVAINAIFSALCNALLWYGDMTTEQVYGITDVSRELLADLSNQDVEIKIVFCDEPDKLEEEYYQKIVHQCALTYAKEFDFIDVEYIDIITDPTSSNKYKNTAASTIKTTNVIIENGGEFRVFAIEGFYTFAESDNSVYAFNGEYKITSAILSLVYDNPIAYFTTGHGEATSDNALRELFETAGYDVRTIDLAREEIDPDAQVVVINGPKYDFMGAYNDVNEIGKIDEFLDNHGNLMVFADPEAMNKQEFKELNEFLSEWGIAFGKSVMKDLTNSVSADGYSLVADYVVEGMGASLTSSLRENLEAVPKTIVRQAMPVEILWDSKSIDQSSRSVAPVLCSTDTTEAYGFDGTDTPAGTIHNLMTVSQDLIYLNNESYTSYVLAVGTTEFTSDDYIYSNAYGNADVIFSAMRMMGREKVPANIDFRMFEDASLDITNAQATTWTVVFCAAIPSVVLVCGIVVWLKRKHL